MALQGNPNEDLRLFQTGEHPCGYWPDRQARDLVLDPQDDRLRSPCWLALAWLLLRSGSLVCRTHCGQCRACVLVRLPLARSGPACRPRRCLDGNAALEGRVLPAERNEEHLALFPRYLHL